MAVLLSNLQDKFMQQKVSAKKLQLSSIFGKCRIEMIFKSKEIYFIQKKRSHQDIKKNRTTTP